MIKIDPKNSEADVGLLLGLDAVTARHDLVASNTWMEVLQSFSDVKRK